MNNNLFIKAVYNGKPFTIELAYYLDDNICTDYDIEYDFHNLSEVDIEQVVANEEWLIFAIIDGDCLQDELEIEDENNCIIGCYKFNVKIGE